MTRSGESAVPRLTTTSWEVVEFAGPSPWLSSLCLTRLSWVSQTSHSTQSSPYNCSAGFLAFTLATKKMKVMLEEPAYMNPSMYHGEINPGFMGDNLSIAGSRKSGGLQPVMLMPHGPVPDER